MDLDNAPASSTTAASILDDVATYTRQQPTFRAAIRLPAALVKALCTWASADTTRPTINQLGFEGPTVASAGHALATDGHRLVAVDQAQPIPGKHAAPTATGREAPASWSVPRETMLEACRLAGAKGAIEIDPVAHLVRAAIPGKKVSRHAGPGPESYLTIGYTPIAASFPPWRQVIPTSREITGAFNVSPTLLAGMADLVDAVGGAPSGVRMSAGGGLDPLLFTADLPGAGYHFDFVIMPMRS